MFEEWKEQMNRYICRHIDREPFMAFAGELDADITELSDHYTSILLENHVIDVNGDETDVDFDEDDLIDEMMERFLADHKCDDERELLYASLIDAYLTLVEESSEDI